MSQQAPHVTRELLDEPHIRGRRVSVLQVYDEVETLGRAPKEVAEDYELEIADVYRALAYYHENSDEMEVIRARRERELTEIKREIDADRPESVTPPS